MDADELYTVKNQFWLGNYEDAIAEARALKLRSEAAKVDRDCYIYRSFIGLRRYKVVTDEVKEGSAVPFQAIKLLAIYFSDTATNKTRVLGAVEAMLADASAAANPMVQLVAATVYLHESQFTNALKVLSTASTLELLALQVQAHLRIDRPDLAEASLKRMAEVDDESALTTLCTGLVRLTQGGDSIREASLLYKELNERFGTSSAGLNGLAAACIAARRFEEADRYLADAVERAPEDPETLVNQIAVASQTGRSGRAEELTARLRAVAPHHPYVESLAIAEGMFDRLAGKYAATIAAGGAATTAVGGSGSGEY